MQSRLDDKLIRRIHLRSEKIFGVDDRNARYNEVREYLEVLMFDKKLSAGCTEGEPCLWD